VRRRLLRRIDNAAAVSDIEMLAEFKAPVQDEKPALSAADKVRKARGNVFAAQAFFNVVRQIILFQ